MYMRLMNGLTRIIIVAAFLTICHLQGLAQGLVTPPAGLPEESWEMTYNYWRQTSNENKRIVSLIRDGNDIYIKGIFEMYPFSWIKCMVQGDRLVIPNGQTIDTDKPIYFHWGACCYAGPLYGVYDKVESTTLSAADSLISFTISEDGHAITSRSKEEYKGDAYPVVPCFWYDNDKRGDWVFDYVWIQAHTYFESVTIEEQEYGSLWPDIPYIINMEFRKVDIENNPAN